MASYQRIISPDYYHSKNSHVIPELIRRFHEAKERGDDEVVAWGSGLVLREFLHVDDMASAALPVVNLDIKAYQQHTTPMLSHLNVGTGIDCSIKELTETIREVVGFNGYISWDITKPDGAPRKLMNSNKLASLGWRTSLTLKDGLVNAYRWYLANLSVARL